MWKQLCGFAVLGSVVAVLVTAVSDRATQGESFTIFDGGTSLASSPSGTSWSEMGQAVGAGAACSAMIGLVAYGFGIRMRGNSNTRLLRVVFAGLLGSAVGLSPVIFFFSDNLSGKPADQGWSIGGPPLLTLYGVSGFFAYCAAVSAVFLSLRISGDELANLTTRYTALILPAGAVAATGCGIVAAWLHKFSTSASTVSVVVVIVALVLAASFAVSRVWALHRDA